MLFLVAFQLRGNHPDAYRTAELGAADLCGWL
jgi:hypothetical protein